MALLFDIICKHIHKIKLYLLGYSQAKEAEETLNMAIMTRQQTVNDDRVKTAQAVRDESRFTHRQNIRSLVDVLQGTWRTAQDNFMALLSAQGLITPPKEAKDSSNNQDLAM